MASSIIATFIFAVHIVFALGKCWEEPELLPFGVNAGDKEIAPFFPECITLDPQFGKITFLGATNGIVCAQKTMSAFYFGGGNNWIEGNQDSAKNPCFRKFNRYVVMPFLNFIKADEDDGGTVSHRFTYDSTDLANLQRKLSPIFPDRPTPDFFEMNLTWAYIITWSNKKLHVYSSDPNACKSDLRNTVQAILVGGVEQTFSIFKYKQLEWTSPPDECKGKPDVQLILSTVGFMSKDAEYVKYLPGSCSEDAWKLAETSNVGIPGEWIYRVDGKSVVQKNFHA